MYGCTVVHLMRLHLLCVMAVMATCRLTWKFWVITQKRKFTCWPLTFTRCPTKLRHSSKGKKACRLTPAGVCPEAFEPGQENMKKAAFCRFFHFRPSKKLYNRCVI